jgi:hypothetical protein
VTLEKRLSVYIPGISLHIAIEFMDIFYESSSKQTVLLAN